MTIHSPRSILVRSITTFGLVVLTLSVSGCFHHNARRGSRMGPDVDRPFVLGHATDAFWETQQTNAEAADFVFHDHEFVGDTAVLSPAARRHLESVALRLDRVPFPIVVEQSRYNGKPDLDRQRRKSILEHLGRMGVLNIHRRVIVAPSFAEGFTAIEGERAYQGIISGNNGNGGGGGGGGVGGGGGLR
ncbi:MAG: hypothetical protein ACI9G1_004207 [Pirellulaceae bacterium]|jgi:hypothetical protein